MSTVELKMPKMGESISEATILNWLKNVGDTVEEDETILEVATDKVDSEVPSPCNGVITEIRYQPNEVIKIGQVIAVIDADVESVTSSQKPKESKTTEKSQKAQEPLAHSKSRKANNSEFKILNSGENDGFLSPLIISIA
jgi:2-oxoglutarate dehydrogenase E2 component (dihydrolipoamide succinyltransferase)